MTVKLRPIEAGDVSAAGKICYDAFAAIASEHNFQRKKVEMLFAQLKRILRLDRLRLRGPNPATNFTSPPPPKTSASLPS